MKSIFAIIFAVSGLWATTQVLDQSQEIKQNYTNKTHTTLVQRGLL